MQIMPGTATHTVKMFSIPGYSSPGQLLDPETNINIGTSYLQYVYQQFGNNRIFSSAAYNAGPGRVRTWLGNSAGRIDAVAFVESIPFSETRGYVKNVLAYDAYYRYFMGDKPTLMSATEWGRHFIDPHVYDMLSYSLASTTGGGILLPPLTMATYYGPTITLFSSDGRTASPGVVTFCRPA